MPLICGKIKIIFEIVVFKDKPMKLMPIGPLKKSVKKV